MAVGVAMAVAVAVAVGVLEGVGVEKEGEEKTRWSMPSTPDWAVAVEVAAIHVATGRAAAPSNGNDGTGRIFQP